MNFEQLQAQLSDVQAEMIAEKQQGVNRDHGKIAQLEEQEKSLLEQIMIAEQQQQQEQQQQETEQKIEQNIQFNVPGVDLTKLPADLIKLINIIVKSDRRRIYDEENKRYDDMVTQLKEQNRAANDREIQLRRQLDELQQKYVPLFDDNVNLKRENTELKTQLDEMTANRDNAGKQLQEKDDEIERLKSEISDYQKAKVWGERQTQSIIDITPEDTGTENVQNLVNNLAKMYVGHEDWGSIIKVNKTDGTFDLVKRNVLEQVQQLATPPEIPIAQPPATQETPFRPEGNDSSAQPESDQLPAAETTSGVGEQFQTDTVDGQSELSASDTGEVVRETSGDLEERVSALEARVAVLEQQGVKAVA